MSALVDLHTHSSYSPDAKDSLGDMVAAAQNAGLRACAVTDHCDCNMWGPAPSEDVTDAMMYGAGDYALNSIAAQYELRERYDGDMTLIVGIELGQPAQALDKAELIAGDPRLDFIIGSQHMNRGMDDFYYLKYDRMSPEELDGLISDYFDQMLEMVLWGRIDILGHLTYPWRYMEGEYGIKVDMSRYEEQIAEVFRALAHQGKGIEINTSGLFQKYGRSFPTLEYVRLFRDLGGEIVSVGSDAHCCEHLGRGIDTGLEIARAAGFDRVAYFLRHEPVFVKI